jgi:hypothetical protein
MGILFVLVSFLLEDYFLGVDRCAISISHAAAKPTPVGEVFNRRHFLAPPAPYKLHGSVDR